MSRLRTAIDMAVEDLFDATNFIIGQAGKWQADTRTIVASGSSAGAISVLQAENYLHHGKGGLRQRLPEGFDYAGVISFAGAIFSTHGAPEWDSRPAPVLFFHGDADANVPYDKAQIFSIGFFGSKFLAAQLDGLKAPYQFFDFDNANHAIAETPMMKNIPEIETFIKKWVIGRSHTAERVRISDLDQPEVKKKFGIGDYVRANF